MIFFTFFSIIRETCQSWKTYEVGTPFINYIYISLWSGSKADFKRNQDAKSTKQARGWREVWGLRCKEFQRDPLGGKF